jgi:hypothetical protein
VFVHASALSLKQLPILKRITSAAALEKHVDDLRQTYLPTALSLPINSERKFGTSHSEAALG